MELICGELKHLPKPCDKREGFKRLNRSQNDVVWLESRVNNNYRKTIQIRDFMYLRKTQFHVEVKLSEILSAEATRITK